MISKTGIKSMGLGSRLLWKYLAIFLALVTVPSVATALLELQAWYGDSEMTLSALHREKAIAAATILQTFVIGIERQLVWVTPQVRAVGESGMEQRREDYYRLLRQEPAVSEVTYLDPDGREQLKISR